MPKRKVILLLLMLCVMTCANDDLLEDYYEPGDNYIEQFSMDDMWS